MKSIQVSFQNELMRDEDFGNHLRAGYIFSSITHAIGPIGALILLPQMWKNMSFESKLKFTEKQTAEDERAVTFFSSFRGMQKDSRTVKHLPKNLLMLFKNAEHKVKKIVEEYGERFIIMSREAKLDVLLPLLSKGSFDAWSPSNPEDKQAFNSIDKIMFFSHTEPANCAFEAVWLMPHHFFATTLNPQNCCTVLEGIAPNRSFLIKAFELPDLNILSQQELEALQKQLPLQIGGFLETVDDWAKECYKGNTTELFLEALQPMFEVTNNLLSNNDILEHCNSVQFGKKRTHVFMGAVSQLEIWNFYCNEGVISEEQKQELEAAYKNASEYFVPVMLFGANEDLYAPVEVGEEEDVEEMVEDVVSAKKFISLD